MDLAGVPIKTDHRLPRGVIATVAGSAPTKTVDQLLAEARDAGRAEAASWWPMVDEEGYMRGRQDERQAIALRLRRLARSDPVARRLLIDVLDG